MKKTIVAMSLCALATSFSTLSQDNIRINGFSNITAGKTSSSSDVMGYDGDIDFSNESVFALQFSVDINDKLTATSQIISRGSEDYSPEFEWAYATYKINQSWSATAGRFRMPLFKYSDSLDVGYSYHWINAPQAVYNVPFNNIDGMRLDFSNYVSGIEYSSQVAFGAIKGDATGLEVKNVALINLNMQYENWKMRVVASRANIDIDISDLDTTLTPFQMMSPRFYDLVTVNDDSALFLGAGIDYDNYEWFIGGEITRIAVDDSYIPDDVSYYVTAGIRMGKWTPSATLEGKETRGGDEGLREAARLPVPVNTLAEGLARAIMAPMQKDYRSFSLGVRYDASSGVALKADVLKMNNLLDENMDGTVLRLSMNYVF